MRYIAANQAYADIVGLPVERIARRPIAEVMGAEAFEAIRPHVERVLGGERVQYEKQVPFASTGKRWLRVVYAPWREGGDIVGWLASISDVTDRHLAEDELKIAGRRKDEFLATLAHELRNPLAPMRNGVDLLRLAAVPGQARIVEVIDRQVTQLTRLIDELMEVTRISHGKVELKRKTIDLRQVLQGAVETEGPAVAAERIRLVVRLPDAMRAFMIVKRHGVGGALRGAHRAER